MIETQNNGELTNDQSLLADLSAVTPAAPSILADFEGPAARIYNKGGRAPIVLVCDHASRLVPSALDGLGLSADVARSHIAWDIGAFDLALELSAALDAPLVASRISRLVYDCNRPPCAPDAIPPRSEVFDIPGNRGLSDTARAARVQAVYEPFRDCLSGALDVQTARLAGGPVALVTVHSFTPIYHGEPRSVELGLLHDADPTLARAMMAEAAGAVALNTQLNAPYDASNGVTHTLKEHAIPRGLPNVMLELRNDLIAEPAGVAHTAHSLARLLERGLSRVGIELSGQIDAR
ncbi:MAG: N-formylglutamate amidohydrolase [Roseitalea sp.]|jgi:predicted N-formylglutamate amidohydrolase|nr:N-formylglutamate amidohydrolase [Roseitalea sp.]MBO6728027.1 N-formylglutamate amidohydrolase [Rhizobiaceae bacterium]MBO6745358.1 N-formylglutamate amidohydrolase [Roseitalea sp.]